MYINEKNTKIRCFSKKNHHCISQVLYEPLCAYPSHVFTRTLKKPWIRPCVRSWIPEKVFSHLSQLLAMANTVELYYKNLKHSKETKAQIGLMHYY